MKSNEKHLPGVQGIWVFILADMMSFLLFFVVFMLERKGQVVLFDESARQLDADLGIFNTIVLLTSSWLLVLAINSARTANRQKTRKFLLLAAAVGSGFAITKGIEYGAKISHDITMLTNDFFMFYFVLTGIHLIHYIIGMAALVLFWYKSGHKNLDSQFVSQLESVGSYWHMVDLLWIVLFALLYLLGVA